MECPFQKPYIALYIKGYFFQSSKTSQFCIDIRFDAPFICATLSSHRLLHWPLLMQSDVVMLTKSPCLLQTNALEDDT